MMKQLIKKILREDFDWINDIEEPKDIDYLELSRQVYTGKVLNDDDEVIKELSNSEIDDLRDILLAYLAEDVFYDTRLEGGKILLEVDGWGELAELFEEGDSRYNVIYRGVAEMILSGDFFEPYSDIYIHDWMDDVWSLVSGDNQKYIIKHIKELFIGDIIEIDGEDVEITEELINGWSEDDLGTLINEVDEFYDIKQELSIRYDRTYNGIVYDNMYESVTDEITDFLGEFKWETGSYTDSKGNERTYEKLLFNISSLYGDIIDCYYENYCDLGYGECDLEYTNFLNILALMLYEGICNQDQLTARYDEYPSQDKMEEYFNDDFYI